MDEKTEFKPDSATTPKGKNNALARHLTGPWSDYAIVRVERIEIGSATGWKVTYRE